MIDWTWIWVGWLCIFVALEVVALADKAPGNTLSEFIRRVAGIGQPRTAWVHARRIAFLAFTAWLVVHIYFDFV